MNCRLCGSNNIRLVGRKVGRYVRRSFGFYRCNDCSFLFVDPCLGETIYDNDYYQGRGADPLVNYESEYLDYSKTPRRYEFEDVFRIVEEHLSPSATQEAEREIRWLDFGCGAGGLLKFLRDKRVIGSKHGETPIICSGFDVGTYASRLAEVDRFKIWDWKELMELRDDNFEVITCIEVVEHLENPMPVFELLGRLLAKNGILVLTTGNLGSPLAKLMGLRFPYCVPEVHVAFFNPQLLQRIYSDVGLSPVQAKFREGLRFKFIKNLPRFIPSRLSERLGRSKALMKLIDALYGVSNMPCATKL